MNAKGILSILLILGCTVLPVAVIVAYERHRTADLTHEIVARAPEKGNFTPSRIEVPVGKKVKLRVRNVDTVVHGFMIPELGLDAGEIKAGHVAILEFTPEKAGSYDFYCTVWCSDYHLQMRGLLVVGR